MSETQAEVIDFLSRPASYGTTVSRVERQETHASVVFLAGEFAYKLKRAIRYPYLDYSTVERRHEMCARELRINRRTAPQLYLAIQPIVRGSDDALRFGDAESPQQAEDWVLVMRRFDQDCLLEQLRQRGQLTPQIARQLGQIIADFHRDAEATFEFGGAEALASVLDENASLLREASILDSAEIARLDTCSRNALQELKDLLEHRRHAGMVRRCHGDLHLNNICLIDQTPVLFDAIEFCDQFACIDVLYDLAFPLMDLIRHRLVAQANALLNRYLERTADYNGLAALPLFLSVRAAIRAHVALARMPTGVAGHERIGEARALLSQALDHLVPRKPRLIAIGGYSGSGKSTLAYGLAPTIAPSPGAVVIRSDLVRKAMLGVAEAARLPETAYSAEMHARVFSLMISRARRLLRSGFSAILDGVYGSPTERDDVARAARENEVPFTGLWLSAAGPTLEARIMARHADASDATVRVLHEQLETIVPAHDWMQVDGSGAASVTLRLARDCLGGTTT